MEVEYVLSRMDHRPNPYVVMAATGAASGFCSFFSVYFCLWAGPGVIFGLALTLPFIRELRKPVPACLWMTLAGTVAWLIAYFTAIILMSSPGFRLGGWGSMLAMAVPGFIGSLVVAANVIPVFFRESWLSDDSWPGTGVAMVLAGTAAGMLFGTAKPFDSWLTLWHFVAWQALTAAPLGRALRMMREQSPRKRIRVCPKAEE